MAIGISALVTGLGGVLGPILGAGMVQAFGWSWIFWINVPMTVALIPAALRFVTETFRSTTASSMSSVLCSRASDFWR